MRRLSGRREEEMPFVINRGVRIHYESIGNGPALVMHHGTFGSGPDWIDWGYVDALKMDHQVILIDSRGHGQSDKPHDPEAYDLALRASDVLAVLDELGLQKVDYFGYSLGGWIGFGLAKCELERFRSFIFLGSHPYAENLRPFRDSMPRDRDAFSVIVDQVFGRRLTPEMRTRLLANDLIALRTLTQDRACNADVMASMIMPCLVLAGELDTRLERARRCASDLPNAAFLSLPECDHVASAFRSDLVIPHLKAFLSKLPPSS
jgi:pimeloyl-ACP methyl ester carboxylesterase